jgi:hypothetical protein
MPQPPHISRLPVPEVTALDADLQKYFRKCQEKLGLVPNVLRASDAFVLTLLGHDDVAVYDASLSEWGADPDLPMATG